MMSEVHKKTKQGWLDSNSYHSDVGVRRFLQDDNVPFFTLQILMNNMIFLC